MHVLNGQDIHLDCNFSFPDDLHYESSFWFKHEQKTQCHLNNPERLMLKYDDRRHFLNRSSKDCTLGIKNVSTDDAGRYCFRFITDGGPKKVWTGQHGLQLFVHAPQISNLPASLTLRDSIQGSINILVSDVYPENAAQIEFCDGIPGEKIVNTTKKGQDGNFTINATVYFTAAISHNQKKCTCKVTHANLAHPLFTSTILDVQYEPRNVSISVNPQGIIKEGDAITLSCTADANPAITSYTWQKILETGSFYNLSSNKNHFKLSSVSQADSGNYSCKVMNAIGVNKAVQCINVQYSPSIAIPVGLGVLFIILITVAVILKFVSRRKKDKNKQASAVEDFKQAPVVEKSSNSQDEHAMVSKKKQQSPSTQNQDKVYANVSESHGSELVYCQVVFADQAAKKKTDMQNEDALAGTSEYATVAFKNS
ncbi:cell adhesion molecule 1-like [Protopterus annectens]|uniref:cell adhesion molecule 1-like n=1 Tax=Protopterus annectens TaxID=7888 RepID=UPI001CFBCD06|nr:cell adhesion molecule 1-like [Protopterus annectens]